MAIDQSGWPDRKARVPSIGSTIHSRGAPRRAGSSVGLLRQPGGVGKSLDEAHLEEGVDRDVGLGHRRAAVLRPDPRGRLPAAPEIAAGDPARLARGLADGGHEREGEVLSKIHDWPRG